MMKLRDRYKPRRGAQLQIPRESWLLPTTASLMLLFAMASAMAMAGKGAVVVSEANNVTAYSYTSGASVNLINALNESVVVHCWSRESNFGSDSLQGGANYYWSFHPNIFGRTVFKCGFLWKTLKQEFAVWKGSAHADRAKCCPRGPCSYKICADGFYNALIVDNDDYGPAESWEYFQPWLPNPMGGTIAN